MRTEDLEMFIHLQSAQTVPPAESYAAIHVEEAAVSVAKVLLGFGTQAAPQLSGNIEVPGYSFKVHL